jgi:hypothetical protein
MRFETPPGALDRLAERLHQARVAAECDRDAWFFAHGMICTLIELGVVAPSPPQEAGWPTWPRLRSDTVPPTT